VGGDATGAAAGGVGIRGSRGGVVAARTASVGALGGAVGAVAFAAVRAGPDSRPDGGTDAAMRADAGFALGANENVGADADARAIAVAGMDADVVADVGSLREDWRNHWPLSAAAATAPMISASPTTLRQRGRDGVACGGGWASDARPRGRGPSSCRVRSSGGLTARRRCRSPRGIVG